jgi:o-succinylbenzoate synthase
MQNNRFHFTFRLYRRKFKCALRTSYGVWSDREGILLQLTDSTGNTGFGEIAPLPWFGSETTRQALELCQSLPDEISTDTIFSISPQLPACQFGFESAWEEVMSQQEDSDRAVLPSTHPLTYSALLPTGEMALHTWQELWQQGHRTFKWKVGVTKVADELKIFEQLRQALPSPAKLRLDANSGLTYIQAKQWLEACDATDVEFFEQPLPGNQLDAMLELGSQYKTPLALDESVATLAHLETYYSKGWRGIFVIKPAIAGSPKQLRQFCHSHEIETVFSSVFEAEVGRRAALKLAAELSSKDRAVGFGIDHWFEAETSELTAHSSYR